MRLNMGIPLDKQAGTDFDWFGIDEEGFIGHFTTAGFKRLPSSVAHCAEDLKRISDYFEHIAPVRGSHNVDENSLAAALQRGGRVRKMKNAISAPSSQWPTGGYFHSTSSHT